MHPCHSNRTNKPLLVLLQIASVTCCLPALADDAPPLVSLSGFGTLGAVYQDSGDGVEFRRDVSQPNGAKSGRISFLPDSMLGVQATAHLSPSFEAAVQLMSRNSIEDKFRPYLSWAYLKYKPVGNVSLRAGCMGIEMYIQGDSTEIGYANLPIRQPVAIYPRTLDGIDAETTLPVGPGTLRLKGAAGRTEGKLLSDGVVYDTEGSAVWNVLAEYTQGGWTGRVSTGRLTLKNEIHSPVLDTLRAVLAPTPNGAAILKRLSLKDNRHDYASIALAYDNGPWQGIASYIVSSSPGWPRWHHFSSNLGYRIGTYTPYAGYHLRRADRTTIPTGIPAGLSPDTDALNEAAAQLQGNTVINQTGVTLGVRHELSRSTAFKLQWDRIRYRDPEAIIDPSLTTVSFENRPTKSMNLFSGALEFVF